ncbi:hypothetical protein DY000_02020588 [Brassica cretica]|uniref:Uncharacterized protein n=1 Tax=Brassica cretica TaxID=69181 RepID=A0ABQ7E9I2_BRACR|nr:hypothetical protein DY000_02020588 [Brassica cretica]
MPQLSAAERIEKSSGLEEDKNPAIYNKFEAQKMEKNSKRSLPRSYKERRSGEDTHRDTRDSVWKRIDPRYDPRVDPRPSTRYDHRHENTSSERQRAPPIRDSYNKRRYEESFHSRKQREASRSERDKGKGRDASPKRTVARDLDKETVRNPPAAAAAAIPQQSMSRDQQPSFV